tara:strand:+ start:692 stop:1333 length:642 start_codon:yes stop_codon:yes gene_type:complete
MSSELKKRILSSIVITPIVLFLIIKGSFFFLFLLIIIFFISLYEWHFIAKNKSYYFIGVIFLIFSFYSIYEIRIGDDNSYDQFLIIFFTCIFTDIGGYVFGKLFRGPKLTVYSPNKTISGLIGSYLLSLSLIPFLINYNLFGQYEILQIIFCILLISSVSQIGDIFISYFKRKSKIKDTGNLIPGHGGILDRIDGMIFAFPFAYLFMINNLLK